MKLSVEQVLALLVQKRHPQPEEIDRAAKRAGPAALVTAALDRALAPTTRQIAAALVSTVVHLGMTADQRARVTASWRSQADPLSSKALALLDILLSDGSAESLRLVSSLSAAQALAWLDHVRFSWHEVSGPRLEVYRQVVDACVDRAKAGDVPKPRPVAPAGMHRYYRVTATLQDAPQPTTRRFLLADDASWDDLHDAIQDASESWERDHMWAIYPRRGRRPLAASDDEGAEGARSQVALHVEAGQRQFVYVYDFGDNWRVAVTFASKAELRADDFHRILVSGKGAFPPEDCGGVGGMYRLMEKFRASGGDFEGEEYEEDWRWDPDDFDLEVAKAVFDLPRRGRR